MKIDSHDLLDEFPEYQNEILRLKAENQRFTLFYDDYHKVNAEVREVEEHDVPISDIAFEELKKRRLKLKDELYALLLEARPA
ncbi:MAG: DUF465 domain-containing protein [Rhodocyclaceae bacterium]|nr:MAG: DUF465 domain-containing protein [Rhodocyclaceae bacterium]